MPPLPKPKPWTATKLQILLPGEVAAPNTASGKTGTPSPRTAGVAFNIIVNAVNGQWIVDDRDHATDTVAITATGGGPTLPANTALVNGTKTLSVTFPTAGTFKLTATDVTDGAITANQSPNVVVNAAVAAFTKLQILLPGETSAPGSGTGKTGTPNVQTVGVAFPVVVNSVDANWNKISSTHTVALSKTGTPGISPATPSAALVAGTTTFQVTVTSGGTVTLTATDTTDGSKTANISPTLTVNQATIATTGILDDFNRANEDPLSGGGRWTANGASGVPSNLKVVSNQLAANAGGNAVTAASYGPNCEVYATLGPATGGFGLNLRVGNIGASFTGYGLSSNGMVQSIVKFGPGGGALGPTFGDVPRDGDMFLFRAVGATLSVYRRRDGVWVQLAEQTDPTSPYLGTGRLGVSIHGDSLTGRIDNLGGGTTAASSAYTKLKVTAPAQATVGVAFNVQVDAVDANNVLQDTVTNRVSLASPDGGNPSVPASPAALVAGTKTFQVTFPAAGTFTLTGTDNDDVTKTPGQSQAITVAPAQTQMPPVVFADGWWNNSAVLWAGGAGGRNQSCDCITTCPGGTPNTSDPLDSYLANPAAGLVAAGGRIRRTTLRPSCKSLLASCLNACELVKDWPNYKLGQTEFLVHRSRVMAPYTGQAGTCVIQQFGYCQVKFNGFGLSLIGGNLLVNFNLGFSNNSAVSGDSYNNGNAYTTGSAGVGYRPVDVGHWHDYIWEVTYSTIFGISGGHPVAGKLKVHHRKPETSAVWEVLHDSTILHPAGVPTRQWGYGLGNNTQQLVDVNGIQLRNDSVGTAGNPRKVFDKMGIYRSDNPNNLTVDHRKFCVASSFSDAQAYLDWAG